MSATLAAPAARPASPDADQRLDLFGVEFEQYLRIADALPEGRGVRLIYVDGRLALATTSRRLDWLSDCLSDLVKAICVGRPIPYAVAGRATFRRPDRDAGVEGDQTFYFRENIRPMRGGVNINLAIQPPPDLAIEAEVNHGADAAMIAWARLGVPEVWRFDANSRAMSFWKLGAGGVYEAIPASVQLPGLTPAEVAEQLRLADAMDTVPWMTQLHAWVRESVVPRAGGVG